MRTSISQIAKIRLDEPDTRAERRARREAAGPQVVRHRRAQLNRLEPMLLSRGSLRGLPTGVIRLAKRGCSGREGWRAELTLALRRARVEFAIERSGGSGAPPTSYDPPGVNPARPLQTPIEPESPSLASTVSRSPVLRLMNDGPESATVTPQRPLRGEPRTIDS